MLRARALNWRSACVGSGASGSNWVNCRMSTATTRSSSRRIGSSSFDPSRVVTQNVSRLSRPSVRTSARCTDPSSSARAFVNSKRKPRSLTPAMVSTVAAGSELASTSTAMGYIGRAGAWPRGKVRPMPSMIEVCAASASPPASSANASARPGRIASQGSRSPAPRTTKRSRSRRDGRLDPRGCSGRLGMPGRPGRGGGRRTGAARRTVKRSAVSMSKPCAVSDPAMSDSAPGMSGATTVTACASPPSGRDSPAMSGAVAMSSVRPGCRARSAPSSAS